MIIRVLDDRGVATFGDLTFAIDPLTENLHVNHLHVYDSSGTLIAKGRIEDYYISDIVGAADASPDRVAHLPVPGLAPGTTIDVLASIGTPVCPDELYESKNFADGIPTHRSEFAIAGSISGISWNTGGAGIEERREDTWICWSVMRPPTLRDEPFLPPIGEIAPWLRISNGNGWQAATESYIRILSGFLQPGDSAVALARAITAGSLSPRSSMEALFRHVQERLRYQAILFGPRARIPRDVEQTLALGYGDCKDFSVLLTQLLRASGLTAWPALCSTDEEIDTGLPTLGQFNHMITAVELDGELVFLDATNRYASQPERSHQSDAGIALVLRPEDSRFAHMPDPPTLQDSITIERSVWIDEHGTMEVSETFCAMGDFADVIRDAFRRVDAAQWGNAVTRLLSEQDGVLNLSDVQISGIDRLASCTVSLVSRYALDNSCEQAGTFAILRPPAHWERFLLRLPSAQSRSHPFLLRSATRVAIRQDIRLPGSLRPAEPERLGHESADDTFVSWHRTITEHPEGLVINSEFTLPKRRGGPHEYAMACQQRSQALARLAASLILISEP